MTRLSLEEVETVCCATKIGRLLTVAIAKEVANQLEVPGERERALRGSPSIRVQRDRLPGCPVKTMQEAPRVLAVRGLFFFSPDHRLLVS